MTDLFSIFKRDILCAGPLSLSHYMWSCLFHPCHGYYQSHNPFGAGGDFITAPEISQLFGELLGVWCVLMWQKMGCPAQFSLVELGPGRGLLMKDLLRASAHIPHFHQAIDLYFVEASARLRGQQAEQISDFQGSVSWVESFDHVPSGPIIVLANEFFDALPIEQFWYHNKIWYERKIDLNDQQDGLKMIALPAHFPVDHFLSGPVKENDVFEVSFFAAELIKQITQRLENDLGAFLLIDYGSSDLQFQPTLQGIKAHQYWDILDHPGQVDLSAHVNFKWLARHGAQQVKVKGPVTQGDFLQAMGLFHRLESLMKKNVGKYEDEKKMQAQVHRLIHPDQMGSLFKAMCFCHDQMNDIPGFDQGE